MRYIIKTPVEGWSGKAASLSFIKGRAETENEKLVEWFKKHGYIVEPIQEPEPAKPKTTKRKGGPQE